MSPLSSSHLESVVIQSFFWPYFSVLLFIISIPKFSSSCLFLKVKTQSPSYVVLSPPWFVPAPPLWNLCWSRFRPRHCHAPDAYQLVFECIVPATYCAPGQVVLNSFTLISWPARTSFRLLKIMSSLLSEVCFVWYHNFITIYVIYSYIVYTIIAFKSWNKHITYLLTY